VQEKATCKIGPHITRACLFPFDLRRYPVLSVSKIASIHGHAVSSMTPTDENQIVERVLKGEREAFAALVDAYKGAIFNLAFRMTDSYQDADDLSQETFIRAYRNLRQFDPQKRFFTWIYTVSLNLIRSHLKKHGREMTRENTARNSPEAGIDQGALTEQGVMQAQEIRHLAICLQKLPADLREAVVLRFYQDLSFEEIASISGASLSAVKMRVYRGLEQLKQLMG
jgi:RNA polymerase sigma-70 factor, ECF subfamily